MLVLLDATTRGSWRREIILVANHHVIRKLLRGIKHQFLPKALAAAISIPRKALAGASSFGFPVGSYSALQMLNSVPPQGRPAGRVILEDQGSPRIPSPSAMVDSGRLQYKEQPWPVFWTHHRNVRLIGRSLVHLNDRKELCEEACYGRHRVPGDPAYNHFIHGKPVALKGAWTSVISKWSAIEPMQPYAHWICDALPRLAALDEFPADTRILIPPYKTRYQIESLELLGLLSRCRWTSEKHLMVEDYYFSSPTSMIVCYNPYAVQFVRKKFLPLAEQLPRMRGRYFVRRRGIRRNMVNEDEVLRFFTGIGWTIVDTAELGFLEQVRLYADAEAVCMIHGSSCANAVWSSPGSKLMEIFADAYVAGDVEWIAQVVGAEYSYLSFPSDRLLNAKVDLNVLREHLAARKLL